MKKVIFVTGSLSDGGAEKVMSILASGCAEQNADVTLVVLRNKKVTYPVSNKVHLIQINDGKHFSMLNRIKELRRVIKEVQPDAIIPFLPIISLYTLLANIGLKNKLIFSERADPNIDSRKLSNKDRIAHILMRKLGLFKKADWMVFQTPDAKAFYGEAFNDKSSIIPNPIDTKRLPVRFTGIREKRIVAAGRFSAQKNFPMLIRAFSEFHKIYPDYVLWLYGEGSLRTEYTNLVQELGISNWVEMPGFVADLPEKMNRAAMYVSTSNFEGISNVMLEALGMGVPTIVTDCPVGGARMFVDNGKNGILIPMNQDKALLDGMVRIVTDSDFASSISVNATQIRQVLSADTICQTWLDLV